MESHYSLVHLATYRGLEFLYGGWQVPEDVAANAQFEDYERHYAQLSQRYGYSVKIPLLTVIQLGNQLLRDQRFEDGIRILKKNLELYPNQPDSHWHVGDAYVLSGQPGMAEAYFESALGKAKQMGLDNADLYEKSLTDLRKELEVKASSDESR
jgi:tetratricopeptide (TPR) repeat protein